MTSLNQILKNVVVYGGLLAALNLSCGDGSDDSGSNGNVESVDAGYNPNEGGEGSEGGEGGYLPPPRKDAGVNYDDANEGGEGEDVGEGGQEGGENLPPVVIIETKDEDGNITNIFKVNEWTTYDWNKTYDPDCSEKRTCDSSKGIDYCEWNDTIGNSGMRRTPFIEKFKYTIAQKDQSITFVVTCYDLDDKLSSTAEATIFVQE